MISFPAYARVGRIIAKENFYNKADSTTKRLFQAEIARITWEYKLSPDTINIPARTWPEIEVFHIELKNQEVPLKALKAIDSSIPYPILFIVAKDNSKKVIISYKEQSQKNSNLAKVDTYFETNWNDPVLDDIKIDGLDIDSVYNNFVRQIANDRLALKSETNAQPTKPNLKSELENMKEREKIQKQIAALDHQIKSEPSIGKKQQLAEEKYRLLHLL